MTAIKRKQILLIAALALMASAASGLVWLRSHQKLGNPGVRLDSNATAKELGVPLPEHVLNYQSETKEIDPIVLGYLPADTSYGQRLYRAPDNFRALVNVVLMGSDRTSIHKPKFCLEGQGWKIDRESVLPVQMQKPFSYELPVMTLVASKEGVRERAIYMYWFVADDAYTADHRQLVMLVAKNMIRTGVLQRWAYVSYLSFCLPGQEEAAIGRVKELITASVPEFQLTPRPADAIAHR